MGISPTEIANPSDLGDFTTALQNSVNDPASLPTNYGVEFFPYKILHPEHDYEKSGDEEQSLIKRYLRRASVSMGYNSENIIETTGENFSRIGFGFKTSLIRKGAKKELKSSDLTKLNTFNANNTLGINLSSSSQKALIYDMLGISEKLIRESAFLDISMAFASDFTGVNSDEMDYSRFGIWLNGGYKFHTTGKETSFALLGTVRYVNNLATAIFANETLNVKSYEAGIKLNFSALKEDFLISAEIIGQRNNGDIIDDSYKYLFNLNYDVNDNLKLGFTLGKDFDNNRTKEGNLISLINFVSSFGTND
jgi:hypothetical protein